MTESTPRKPAKIGASWAIGGVTVFALGIIALHFLSPEFTVLRHSLSQYALGEWGLLLKVAFVSLGVGMVAFAYSQVVEFPEEERAKLGAFLFIVAGFGFIFAAILNADPGDVGDSLLGQFHVTAIKLSIFASLAGTSLVSRKLLSSSVWQGVVALLLSLGGWVAYYLWQIAIERGLVGVPQRALFGVLVLWVMWAAVILFGKKTGE